MRRLRATNRVTLSLSSRLLARPEVGALVAAVVIFIFFLIVAPAFRSPASFFTVLYQSSTIGIVAVAVGMLMIGGEFDLSAGVVVTSAGLVNAMLSYQLGLNLWVGAVVGVGVRARGGVFMNGYLVMRTGIPELSDHVGDVFHVAGRELWGSRSWSRGRCRRATSTRWTAIPVCMRCSRRVSRSAR